MALQLCKPQACGTLPSESDNRGAAPRLTTEEARPTRPTPALPLAPRNCADTNEQRAKLPLVVLHALPAAGTILRHALLDLAPQERISTGVFLSCALACMKSSSAGEKCGAIAARAPERQEKGEVFRSTVTRRSLNQRWGLGPPGAKRRHQQSKQLAERSMCVCSQIGGKSARMWARMARNREDIRGHRRAHTGLVKNIGAHTREADAHRCASVRACVCAQTL